MRLRRQQSASIRFVSIALCGLGLLVLLALIVYHTSKAGSTIARNHNVDSLLPLQSTRGVHSMVCSSVNQSITTSSFCEYLRRKQIQGGLLSLTHQDRHRSAVRDILLHLPSHPADDASAITLHSWTGFFGDAVVGAWLLQLIATWERGEWVVATNNDGQAFGPKEASSRNVALREAFAKKAYDDNGGPYHFFGYVKRELPRDHPLHMDFKHYVNSVVVRRAVATMLLDVQVHGWRVRAARIVRRTTVTETDDAKMIDAARDDFVQRAILGDFFVSLYAAGDFLTEHTDDSLGSVAVVGHFAIRRNHKFLTGSEEDGEKKTSTYDSGALRFKCADRTFCVKIPIAHDELLVFPTQPNFVSHMVDRNDDPDLLRFGFTGWFAMPGEVQLTKY